MTANTCEIPSSAAQAKEMMNKAEQRVERLSVELGVALAENGIAVDLGDAGAIRKAVLAVRQANTDLDAANEELAFLNPIAERLAIAQARIDRDRRRRRFEELKSDMKKIAKDLQQERSDVISIAKQFVLNVKSFSDVVAETRADRNEFAALEKEFAADKPRMKMPELQIRDFQLVHGLPLHEALKDITGSKQNEFRNRSRRPLRFIDRHARMIKKGKK